MAEINWNDYDNFSKAEFDCKHTGENGMRPAFMDRLQALRYEWGKPMVITSGYRAASHPIEARKARPGPHSTGRACDVAIVPGQDAYQFVRLAYRFGFSGIGVSQKAGGARFIHLDMLEREAIWSY